MAEAQEAVIGAEPVESMNDFMEAQFDALEDNEDAPPEETNSEESESYGSRRTEESVRQN